MQSIWNQVYWNNSALEWLYAVGILLVCFIIVRIVRSVVITRLKKLFDKTRTTWDNFLVAQIESSLVPVAYVLSVYMALTSLRLPARFNRVLMVAMMVVVTYFILRVITAVVKELIFSFIKSHENSETKEKQAKGLIIILNIVIWMLGIIFLIDNFGYDVTTLVAGLGIGGIAIALAAQTILGDLFSYFVIFFDRPFEIGDFIVVDDKMGVVEYIGIKTTRIKTLSGEQLVCSNTDLTNSRLHNFKRMERRRVVFKIGVIYQTPVEQVKQIPVIIKDIITAKEDTTFDRGHFSGFGDSSLDFEFVYYVAGSDYNIYMDIQQSIYLEILEQFEKEKIEFAYPTRTLFVQRDEAAEPAPSLC